MLLWLNCKSTKVGGIHSLMMRKPKHIPPQQPPAHPLGASVLCLQNRDYVHGAGQELGGEEPGRLQLPPPGSPDAQLAAGVRAKRAGGQEEDTVCPLSQGSPWAWKPRVRCTTAKGSQSEWVLEEGTQRQAPLRHLGGENNPSLKQSGDFWFVFPPLPSGE